MMPAAAHGRPSLISPQNCSNLFYALDAHLARNDDSHTIWNRGNFKCTNLIEKNFRTLELRIRDIQELANSRKAFLTTPRNQNQEIAVPSAACNHVPGRLR
jgi:hypothetical protein